MPRSLSVVVLVTLALSTAPVGGAQSLDSPLLWSFMNRFITPDGAVVDTQNNGMSHSEGQGYGMLIAVAADDRRRFEQIHQWTTTHLAVREDGLLAWSWNRQEGRIGDMNAATDGDMLVAWALLQAAERWNAPSYRRAAERHLDAIEPLVVRHGGRWLIKPGPSGFMPDGDALHVNLSYWVFPALQAFAKAHDGPWQAVLEDGLELARGVLEQRAVIPDWIRIGPEGTIHPSSIVGQPGRSGFDAIRVPLYLHWARLGRDVAERHWQGMQRPDGGKAVVLVRETAEPVVHMAGDHAGYAAIGALVSEPVPRWPAATLAHDYYPAALQVLSRLATASEADA